MTETTDSILNGALRIIQPREGYRFSIDAVLLGRFIRPRRAARILELGAGCGVISIMAAFLYAPRRMVALEAQAELAALTNRNAQLNQLPVEGICADIRAPTIDEVQPASFDWVIANPPYRAGGSGRRSPVAARNLARAEGEATLGDFIGAAARYLKHGGSAAFVFTSARAAELISGLRAARLEPKRMRLVHPRLERPATTMLIEARKGAGVELEIEPPLILYTSPGVYSPEAARLMGNGEPFKPAGR